MFTNILYTLWACTQLSIIGLSRSELVCLKEPSSAIQLSIRSQRSENSRVLSLDMEREESNLTDKTRSDPWTVDVEFDVRTCETRGNILHVTLTLTHNLTELQNNNVTSNVAKPFRPDYELVQGIGYYKFHDIAKDWETARQSCVDEGAHLIIINSKEEADVIKTFFDRNPNITETTSKEWSWIGAERKSGAYFAIDGTPINNTGFTKWQPGYPIEDDTRNCFAIHKSVSGLQNSPCSFKIAYVCEK